MMASVRRSICLLLLLCLSASSASPVPEDTTSRNDDSSITLASRDDVNAQTNLFGFEGCDDKDDKKKKKLYQAFKDAVMIAKGMGDPSKIDFGDTLTIDFFGKDTGSLKNNIINNFKRAQAPASHWVIGDIWLNRNYQLRCDDPGDQYGATCKKSGLAAYTVDAHDKKLKNGNPVINFCPMFFTSYDPTSDVIKNINDYPGTFRRDDVKSMKSQGSTFLHEMFHTVFGKKADGRAAGISDPKCVDKTLGSFSGKAYGPARAKFLARATLGGSDQAYVNVDTYVYYAIARFMYAKWKILPYEPKAAWVSAKEAADVTVDDVKKRDDMHVARDEGALMSDSDTYGTNEPLQCVGEPSDSPSTTQAYAADKITEYCKYMASAKQPIIDAKKNYSPVGYQAGTTSPWSDNDLWLSISWNDACTETSLTVEQSNCERLMNDVVNGCNTNSKQKKYGGTIFSGCGVYDILVRNGHGDLPPKGFYPPS